jgi:hypothetical protein
VALLKVTVVGVGVVALVGGVAFIGKEALAGKEALVGFVDGAETGDKVESGPGLSFLPTGKGALVQADRRITTRMDRNIKASFRQL